MHFASSTNIHGVVDVVQGFHPVWRVTMGIFLLGALIGLFVQASVQFEKYASQPTQTTLSPWYPRSLPELKFCPAETQLYRKLEEAVIPDKSERDAWNAMADNIVGKGVRFHFPAMSLFVESLFIFGNFFWIGRFGRMSTLKDNGGYDKTWADTGEMAHGRVVELFDSYLKRANKTIQDVIMDVSADVGTILETTGNVWVTKRVTTSGTCYVAAHNASETPEMLRFSSYTLRVKERNYSEVASIVPHFNFVAVGEYARSVLPFRGTKFVSFPGHYTFTAYPARYRLENTAQRPCAWNMRFVKQEACIFDGISSICKKAVAAGARPSIDCGFIRTDGFLDDGTQYSWSSNDKSVANLCSYFKVRDHCLIEALLGGNITAQVMKQEFRNIFDRCEHPCAHTGYRIEISVVRGSESAITVQYGDVHQSLSYTQGFLFKPLQLVGSVGGIMGVWVGASFLAILHALYGCCMSGYEYAEWVYRVRPNAKRVLRSINRWLSRQPNH